MALSSTATRIACGELRIAESGVSALIVSSSNSQATAAAELAQQLGFQIRVAHSGKEALKLIGELQPDVVLTDATLPDAEAIGFAPAVRKAVGNRPLAVIAWSSNAEKEDKLLAPGTGIDDFVLKTTSKEGTGLVAAALLGSFGPAPIDRSAVVESGTWR